MKRRFTHNSRQEKERGKPPSDTQIQTTCSCSASARDARDTHPKHTCTSALVRTLTDIMHSLAAHPNPNQNPTVTSPLKHTLNYTVNKPVCFFFLVQTPTITIGQLVYSLYRPALEPVNCHRLWWLVEVGMGQNRMKVKSLGFICTQLTHFVQEVCLFRRVLSLRNPEWPQSTLAFLLSMKQIQ